MKKVLILFLCMAFTVLTLGLNIKAAEQKGTVRIHYQNWTDEYSETSGLHFWGNTTESTQWVTGLTGQDDFGAYYDIPIYDDATDTIGAIVIESGSGNWDTAVKASENLDGIDVTAIKDGTVQTIDVYTITGGLKTNGTTEYYVADPAVKNVLVVYYDATEAYEKTLGVHSWEGWTPEYMSAGWGTPLQIFTDGFKTNDGKQGKAGLMKATEDAEQAKMLVYAGDDASKKHPSYGENGDLVVDLKNVKVGELTVAYVTAGNVFLGADQHIEFANNFKFKFIEYSQDKFGVESGTYAAKTDSLFVSFSTDVALTYKEKYIGPEEQTVGYRPVPVPGGKEFNQTETIQTEFTELPELNQGMAGRIVFHYQKWDGDYTSSGLWTWGTGKNGSPSQIESLGVDEFGAVMDIQFAADATTIGIIPIKNDITLDTRWNYRETPDGANINYDVTDKTGEIHLYYFEGGHQEVYEIDNTKANILVVDYLTDGSYPEKLAFYGWNLDTTFTDFGVPETLDILPFTKGMGNPTTYDHTIEQPSVNHNVQGRVGLIKSTSFADGGFLVYGGSNETKQTDNNASDYITDLATLGAGDVRVLYIVDKTAFYGADAKATFAATAFGEVKLEPIKEMVDVEKTRDVYFTAEEIISRFTLLADGTPVTINGINDFAAAKAKDFLLLFDEDNLLDNTKTYVLKYENEKLDEFGKPLDPAETETIEITVNIDTEKPVITITNKTVKIIQGAAWNPANFPIYQATDNRDGDITQRVYVKAGEGTVDLDTPGNYTITLTVEDDYGNVGTNTFTITVETIQSSGCNNGTSMLIMSLSLLGAALMFAFKRKY